MMMVMMMIMTMREMVNIKADAENEITVMQV